MDKRLVATLYAEAKTMRGDLEKIEPEAADRPSRSGSGISAFVYPFNDLVSRVQRAAGGDLIALDAFATLPNVEPLRELLSATYHKQKKFEMMNALGRILAVLEPLLSEQSVSVPMRATREGVFFAGEYYEPLRLCADLIAQARQSIVIIDGYLGDGQTVLGLLAAKGQGVTARLLTFEVEPTLLTLAQAFHKQHGGLELRTSRAFHDRFVILDDSEFYHFGASLKDLGSRGFMLSRIEEPEVIEKIRAKFAEEWTKAVPLKLL